MKLAAMIKPIIAHLISVRLTFLFPSGGDSGLFPHLGRSEFITCSEHIAFCQFFQNQGRQLERAECSCDLP